MNRWILASGSSLLVHTALAVVTLGMSPSSPHLEVTPGEAKVAIVFQSKPITHRRTPALTPVPKEKVADVATVLPEEEGVESTAAQSLINPPPPYPLEAFRRRIQGVTSLLVQVDPRGVASSVALERSSGSMILDEAASQAVAQWIFLPARRAGIPIPGSIRIRMRFQIVEAQESS